MRDLDEKSVINESVKDEKINKQLENRNLIKTIFVKNKIINFLLK